MTAGRQAGSTMVELVISIVVISIAVSGVLMAISYTVGHSADPMIQQQAVAVARAYLEEITPKSFEDPTGGETGGPEAGETRPTFDDVQDYQGLSDNPPRDQEGNAIAGLTGYAVTVTVSASGVLGPGGSQVPAASARRIDVRVTHIPDVDITVSAYRANY